MIKSLPSMMVPYLHILDRKIRQQNKRRGGESCLVYWFMSKKSKGTRKMDNNESEKLIQTRINN
jgi:hypothetical protein